MPFVRKVLQEPRVPEPWCRASTTSPNPPNRASSARLVLRSFAVGVARGARTRKHHPQRRPLLTVEDITRVKGYVPPRPPCPPPPPPPPTRPPPPPPPPPGTRPPHPGTPPPRGFPPPPPA